MNTSNKIHAVMTLLILGSQTKVQAPAIPPVPTTSFPVFRVPEDPYEIIPKFLPFPQVIETKIGATALLECVPTPLSNHHTVSWVRVNDVSVLTVGSLVFSSDPRIGVVLTAGENADVWGLKIEKVTLRDQGKYLCQVNTRKRVSWPVSLRVISEEGSNSDKLFVAREGLSVSNIDNQEERVSIEKESFTNTVISTTAVSEPENKVDKETNIESPVSPSTYPVILHNSEASTTPRPALHSDNDGLSPILASTVCFSIAVVLGISVGAGRGLYRKCKDEPQDRGSRPVSRTGTLDSRRSSGSRISRDSERSRSSRESNKSIRSTDSRKSRRNKRILAEEEMRRTRLGLAMYEEVKAKPKLSPLIERIEPTPQIDWRKKQLIDSQNKEIRKEINGLQDTDAHIPNDSSDVLEMKKMPTVKIANGAKVHRSLFASIETLSEPETVEEATPNGKLQKAKNSRKIRFNPYDEFSD